jgi:hypothetical protein
VVTLQWSVASLACASLLALIAPVTADELADGTKAQLQALDGPSSTSVGPSNQSKVTAQAAGDTSQASTQLTHIWPLQGRNGAITGSVMAAAPFSDSNAPKADLGSVSNLLAGTNARLDGGWLFLPSAPEGDKADTVLRDFNHICDDLIEAALGKPYYCNATPDRLQIEPDARHALALMKNVPGCPDLARGSTFSDLVKQLNADIAARNKTRAPGAAIEPLLKLDASWQTAAKAATQLFSQLNAKQPSTLHGISLSLLGNQHSYSYVTKASPATVVKQSTEGYGVGANYTAVFQRMSLIVGYSYERPFKGGQGQQVCTPIGTTTSTTCNTATVGAPVRTTARIVSGEARILLNPDLALGPRMEYDTVSANFGIKLPVYFVPDAKKVLTGGLAVGWTKQGRYQGAVVIQKAFSFFN